MGLELCQVLDSVKLMLRASVMKRRRRMKSPQYHNRNDDDSKMNLMVCIYIYIYIYSSTNDHFKLYRFIHDTLIDLAWEEAKKVH